MHSLDYRNFWQEFHSFNNSVIHYYYDRYYYCPFFIQYNIFGCFIVVYIETMSYSMERLYFTKSFMSTLNKRNRNLQGIFQLRGEAFRQIRHKSLFHKQNKTENSWHDGYPLNCAPFWICVTKSSTSNPPNFASVA